MRSIAITGASGFIGGALARRCEERGTEVLALSRRPASVGRWIKWEIGNPLPLECSDVDAVVHLASASLVAREKMDEAVALDIHGASVLARSTQAAGNGRPPRFVFLSSQSASAGAKNAYGKSKFIIEGALDAANTAVIRPGLVYDDAGSSVFGMFEKLARLPAVPVVSRRQNIQPIHVEELVDCITKVVEAQDPRRLYCLGAVQPMTFSDAIKATAMRSGRSAPIGIPVPLAPIQAAAWCVDKLLRPTPTIGERLDGLVALQPMETAGSLAALGVELKAFQIKS